MPLSNSLEYPDAPLGNIRVWTLSVLNDDVSTPVPNRSAWPAGQVEKFWSLN